MKIAALDVGGGTVKGAFYVDRKKIGEYVVPTRCNEPTNIVYGQFEKAIWGLMGQFGQPDAIGIVSAGDIDHEKGIYERVFNIPCMVGFHLKEHLEKDMGVPVYFDNDAVGALLGEASAYPELKNIVMLTFGTGIGCAAIIEGKVVHDEAHDYGHYCLVPNGRVCSCGKKGCSEALLSAKATRAILKEEFGRDVIVPEFYGMVRKGDEKSKRIFGEFATNLQKLLDTIVADLNPERIILGGGMMNSHDLIEPLLVKYKGKVVFAQFGNEAGVLGAAILAEKKGDVH